MKYWIFKIVGILGLFLTPFIYIGYADKYLMGENVYFIEEWVLVYQSLLILFLIITLAGFARPIARLKALIDFHFDFEDDQELEDYPKLHTFAIIKRIVFWTASFGGIALGIMTTWFPALNNYIVGYLICAASLIILLALINIIICICKQINPIYSDIAVIFAIVGFALYLLLPMWGASYLFTMIICSPIFAIALLYLAFAADDLISFDEVFDWICADEYNEYYKKLCEREKEQEAKKELSENKQAKQNKIQVKQTKRAEKKETKQAIKTEKKTNKTKNEYNKER